MCIRDRASGINAYAVVLVMGLFGRFAEVSAIPGVLTRTDVLIASGALFVVEMLADKIPYLDSVWDLSLIHISEPTRPY